MSSGSNYQRLCIIAAVDIEFNTATGLLAQKSFSEDSRVCRGTSGKGRQVTVLKSGMRADGFAGRLERHLNQDSYDAVIVAGLAGGLDPKLNAGDAVVYNLCHDARNPIFREKEPDRDKIASIVLDYHVSKFVFETLLAAGISSVQGNGVTVSEIVTESKKKREMGLRYGAKAVDMETFEVGLVCKQYGTPMAALRIISDDATADIPDFNRAYRVDGRTKPARMAAVMLAKPARTARFLRNLRTAIGSLKRSLESVYDA